MARKQRPEDWVYLFNNLARRKGVKLLPDNFIPSSFDEITKNIIWVNGLPDIKRKPNGRKNNTPEQKASSPIVSALKFISNQFLKKAG